MPDQTVFIVISSIIIIVSGFVQGVTGFGFALFAAPLLTIFIDPKMVVPAITLQLLVSGATVLWHAFRHLRVRHMWLMALSGMIGVPLGTLLLLVLDQSVLRLVIGLIVTVTTVAMIFGFSRPLRSQFLISAPVGLFSGILGASTGLSGPPVIFFYTNQGLDPKEFRANITAHFFMLNIVTLISFIVSGMYTSETLALSFRLLPATIAGVIAGIIVNRWVNATRYRRIALGLILISGIVAVITGIANL